MTTSIQTNRAAKRLPVIREASASVIGHEPAAKAAMKSKFRASKFFGRQNREPNEGNFVDPWLFMTFGMVVLALGLGYSGGV